MLPVAAMMDARPDVFQRWANTVLLVPMPMSNRPMSAALRICVNDGQASPRTRATISNNDPAVRKRVATRKYGGSPVSAMRVNKYIAPQTIHTPSNGRRDAAILDEFVMRCDQLLRSGAFQD